MLTSPHGDVYYIVLKYVYGLLFIFFVEEIYIHHLFYSET